MMQTGCRRGRGRGPLGLVLLGVLASLGANYRTANFEVEAADDKTARRLGLAAEEHRRELAIRWLGRPIPRWAQRCRIKYRDGRLAAGGATTFSFQRGEVFGWRMTLQGPLPQVVESILPHEITHTILACRFRRPLPRWVDEGAATLAESSGERRRQYELVGQLLRTGRQLPLERMLKMREYPSDHAGMLALYAQGASLVAYLVERGGHARFLNFVDEAESSGWTRAVRRHYGQVSLAALQRDWAAWAARPSPRVLLGRRSTRGTRPTVIRGQSPAAVSASVARTTATTAGAAKARTRAVRRSIWRAPDPRLAVRPPARRPALGR